MIDVKGRMVLAPSTRILSQLPALTYAVITLSNAELSLVLQLGGYLKLINPTPTYPVRLEITPPESPENPTLHQARLALEPTSLQLFQTTMCIAHIDNPMHN